MENVKALAFFDLDGTLLDADSKITTEVAQAMEDLRNNGVMPVIATGRTNIEIVEIMAASGINSAITMNGQYVQFDGKEIYSSLIPTDVCERMAEKTESLNHGLGFYNHEQITITKHNENAKAAYDFIHSPLPQIQEDFYKKANVNMLLALCKDGDEHYHEAFPELTFYRNGPFSIDIVAKGGSKGRGVQELVAALNYQNLPTYAFGDGLNDLDLFKACEYRIAMGNARPALKELATFITKDNTDGGIVHGLRHYNLI